MNGIQLAKIIVDSLASLGITQFYLSPGSRSTPLAIAISENKNISSVVHFDERATGFAALGFAKGSGRPAAIVVTSGSAVANLLPAVMEAHNDHIPLIVLTADRPYELHDCGANQTIEQMNLFKAYLRWQATLPCCDREIKSNFLSSTISHAVFRSLHTKGPVQINCMFREPFHSDFDEFLPNSILTQYVSSQECLDPKMAYAFADLFQKFERGVILLGNLPPFSNLDSVFEVAEKLGWPILPDVLSGGRGHSSSTISYYHAILEHHKWQPELILQLGSRLIEKRVHAWIQNSSPEHYLLVDKHPYRQDPHHMVTDRIVQEPILFMKEISPLLTPSSSNWRMDWEQEQGQVQESLHNFFHQNELLSEPHLFFALKDILPEEFALFIASSMPIRDAERFFFPENKIGPIFANRGVSGIDGNIATIVGLSHALERPMAAIIGDQTALYDLTSLHLLKTCKFPVVLILINNEGGAIFSFLPIHNQMEAVGFEKYFTNPHGIDFAKAASLFQIPYLHLSGENWKDLLENAISQKTSMMIELRTDRKDNLLLHREIELLCKEALSAF